MYYSEAVRREPNGQGVPRLVSIIATFAGAIHFGFDGDGTPPKRGEEDGRFRLWEFAAGLKDPLPEGVAGMTNEAFATAIATRESRKPEGQ